MYEQERKLADAEMEQAERQASGAGRKCGKKEGRMVPEARLAWKRERRERRGQPKGLEDRGVFLFFQTKEGRMPMRRVYVPPAGGNPSMSQYAHKAANWSGNKQVRLTGDGPYRSRAWAEEEWRRLTARQATTTSH